MARATRTYRIIKHQDDHEPFASWGTLHVQQTFDMAKFRKTLHRKSKARITNFVVFIEQAKRSARPHFHFLFPQHPDKQQLRQLLIDCLPTGHKIRLQIRRIDPARRCRLFAYLAKTTQPYAGRSLIEVGHVWHKPTSELGKMTIADIKASLTRAMMVDATLTTDILTGRVTQAEYLNPKFLSWWRTKQRHESEAYNYYQE